MAILSGIHPVAEALRAKRAIERILVAQGAGGPRMQEIIDMARRAAVPVRFEPRGALDRLAGSAAHQGVVAMGAANKYADFETLISSQLVSSQLVSTQQASAPLVVVLDGVEDPHNLGAVIRTAHAAGAGAVIIPERRAAGVTDVVAKAAAGALEYLPVTRVTNINRALEELKEKGYWIYGLDERGTETYDQADYAAPTAFVLGGEGKGLHEQVRKHCDVLVRIPMAGKISSLNVSVAAGVVLFEWKRRVAARATSPTNATG
ncbi:MAG: 23S rRNA (guanosine(2251)-2'-O)-methyltransferase RlmB [Bryobacteraceae bacterium]|jgi:23S rRNA (guanosine2251-2'-O)-methyltransferase